MSNLINDLGRDYCLENIVGSIFFVDGAPHLLADIDRHELLATRIDGTAEAPLTVQVRLPISPTFDKGFESLAHPNLGYRVAAGGKLLLMLTSTPSFRRGLQHTGLRSNFPTVSEYIAHKLELNLRMYNDPYVKARLVVETNFTPLAEGLKKIADGSLYLFAVNEDIAVVPSPRKGLYLDLLYKDRIVGHIDTSGSITGEILKANKMLEALYGTTT